MTEHLDNHAAFLRAQTAIPGGVNSPVRAYGSVGGDPRFLASARGPYVTDVAGREYVDLVCSWGPALLGHAHPEVVAAVQDAAARAGEEPRVAAHRAVRPDRGVHAPGDRGLRAQERGVVVGRHGHLIHSAISLAQ